MSGISGAPPVVVQATQVFAQWLAKGTFAKSLTPPPQRDPGTPIVTATGTLNSVTDIHSVANSSDKGGMDFLWYLAQIDAHGTDVTQEADLEALNKLLGLTVEPVNQDTVAADPVAVTIILLLGYGAAGVIGGADKRTIFAGSSLTHPAENADTFLANYSHFSSHTWLSDLATRVLFCTPAAIQAYFTSMGQLVESWLISHASGGSAAFGRLSGMSKLVGTRSQGAPRVYGVLNDLKVIPAFGIAHLAGSFQAQGLEDWYLGLSFMKVAKVMKPGEAKYEDFLSSLYRSFMGALPTISKEDAKKPTGQLLMRTVISEKARESLQSRLQEGIERWAATDALSEFKRLHNPLTPDAIYYANLDDSFLTVPLFNIVIGNLGLPARAAAGTSGLRLEQLGTAVTEFFAGHLDQAVRIPKEERKRIEKEMHGFPARGSEASQQIWWVAKLKSSPIVVPDSHVVSLE